MKDLISKLTFGFLMAQFVPGLIVIYACSFTYIALTGSDPQEIKIVAQRAIDIWADPLVTIFLFLGLSVGSGMAIHGLHWAVLGFLESHFADRHENRIVKLKPVFETFWHDKPIYLQIIVGPVKIVAEIMLLLFKARSIREIAIEENVCAIDMERIEGFKFLQDFYLYFSQFYAHTSYALIALIAAISGSIILTPGLTFSIWNVFALILVWMLSGFFFVIGRVQLACLFIAENTLCEIKPEKNNVKST